MRKRIRGKKIYIYNYIYILWADSKCSIKVRSSHFLDTVYCIWPHLLDRCPSDAQRRDSGNSSGSWIWNQRPVWEKQDGSTREPGLKRSQFLMQGGEEKAERFSVKQKAAGEARKGRDQSSRAGIRVPSPIQAAPSLQVSGPGGDL